LAQEISLENNYAYIAEIESPALVAWAETYGFTLDELKWIQPTYQCMFAICPSDSVKDVSCHGAYDGCIGLPTSSLTGTVIYKFFKYNDLSSQWLQLDQSCDLPAGFYKWTVINSGGSVEEFNYELKQPSAISISPLTINDNGTCNGSINLSFAGGNPPYRVSWLHIGATTPNITGLCHGTYAVEVTDDKNCSKIFYLSVALSTAISDLVSNEAISIYPNPTSDHISISSQMLDSNLIPVVIFDYTGKQVMSTILSNTDKLDVSHLQNGTYVLKIGAFHQRFMKYCR
jgi:Secretion system C-terminal sorting domain